MAAAYPMTLEVVRDALRDARGNLTKAAERIRCTRQTIYNYIKDHPELEDVRNEARQTALDRVEDRLWDAAEDGESWAVTFALKTQAKDRGYSERHEVTGADGGALDVTHALKGMENLSTEEAVQLYQKIMAGGGGKR
jgi:hypothetical protein